MGGCQIHCTVSLWALPTPTRPPCCPQPTGQERTERDGFLGAVCSLCLSLHADEGKGAGVQDQPRATLPQQPPGLTFYKCIGTGEEQQQKNTLKKKTGVGTSVMRAVESIWLSLWQITDSPGESIIDSDTCVHAQLCWAAAQRATPKVALK